MPQMGRFAILRYNIAVSDKQEMQMLGHDDIILNFQHWIELVYAFLEFFFHHFPNWR